MKRNLLKDYAFMAIGIIFILFGLVIDRNFIRLDFVSYIFIIAGLCIFGHFVSNILKYISIKNIKGLERKIEIDKNDERNIMIMNKSKSKAYDLMTYLFMIVIIAFSFMNIDKLIIIVLLALYLIIQIYAIFCRFKFEREM